MQTDSLLDTYSANESIGFAADTRTYEAPLAILDHLGVRRIDLLSNNPDKWQAFVGKLAKVTPMTCSANRHNARYLAAKRERAQQNCETAFAPFLRAVSSARLGIIRAIDLHSPCPLSGHLYDLCIHSLRCMGFSDAESETLTVARSSDLPAAAQVCCAFSFSLAAPPFSSHPETLFSSFASVFFLISAAPGRQSCVPV